jgi:hypothetical protein
MEEGGDRWREIEIEIDRLIGSYIDRQVEIKEEIEIYTDKLTDWRING